MGKALDNLRVEDDGLLCPEIRWWAQTKYRLISLYDELFTTGMKNKWEQRVYIDLYSGAGYGRLQSAEICLKGSPILALTVSTPFDKYIFCEEDEQLRSALEKRVKRIAPNLDTAFVPGNCDEQIELICNEIPKASQSNRVLSLCLIDPFDFGIKFKTIRRLSTIRVDFLVLLAVGMDANRNYDHYVEGNHPKIDEALGNVEWRERWKKYPGGRRRFREFLAEEFAASMSSLGYLAIGPDRMKLVRSDERNLPLYYLALFSRHSTGYQFWEEVLKYSTDQTSFSWE